MIDLGEHPLHAADSGFVRADLRVVLAAIRDPWSWPVFWDGAQTYAHTIAHTPGGAARADGGDAWRVRTLLGTAGLDAEVAVTGVRRTRNEANVWADLRGTVDPFVGLSRHPRAFEAECEWYLRRWRDGTVVTTFWKVPGESPKAQQRLMAVLRRFGWRGMHGLKLEFESDVTSTLDVTDAAVVVS